jgi:transposase
VILGGVPVAGRRPEDPKAAALREARALNPHPEAVTDEAFLAEEFLDARDLVQVKYEMVRRVRAEGQPVSAAAAAFGFSRPSWYAAAEALDRDGLPGLLAGRPGPRAAHKLTGEIVDFLEQALVGDPSLRSTGLAAMVTDRFGITVHPRSVERALARRQGPKSG